MAIAKAISANDVIDGTPAVLHGSGDLTDNYVWNNPEYAPHITSPVAGVQGRWIGGEWSEESLPTGTKNGQVKIAVTGTPVRFPSNVIIQGVIITAYDGNTGPVVIGGPTITNTVDGTGNGSYVGAGASISAAVRDTNELYLNGTAGDWVSFSGS